MIQFFILSRACKRQGACSRCSSPPCGLPQSTRTSPCSTRRPPARFLAPFRTAGARQSTSSSTRALLRRPWSCRTWRPLASGTRTRTAAAGSPRATWASASWSAGRGRGWRPSWAGPLRRRRGGASWRWRGCRPRCCSRLAFLSSARAGGRSSFAHKMTPVSWV